MKAIGLTQYLPIENSESLQDIELSRPEASDHDLLVKVKAISVNPVDTKIRAPKDVVEALPRILGWVQQVKWWLLVGRLSIFPWVIRFTMRVTLRAQVQIVNFNGLMNA